MCILLGLLYQNTILNTLEGKMWTAFIWFGIWIRGKIFGNITTIRERYIEKLNDH
jgi:hypothetical protein